MDVETFISWALDDTRTLEERYTTELLVEMALRCWHARHRSGRIISYEETRERKRERFINPAYQPSYSEEDLHRAGQMLPLISQWELTTWGDDRPVRDVAVLRFLPNLERLRLNIDLADASQIPDLPRLRWFGFNCPPCEDYRPLARFTQIEHLSLHLAVHWPEIDGLEQLQQLESFHLTGNLLVFPPGMVFPRVRRAKLNCAPLHAKNMRDLPQFPSCEFLTLGGVERLDGIEAMPRLRNLTLSGLVRDFSPLTALRELTWLQYGGALPLDVAPLARVPALLFASFSSSHVFGLDKAPPRDYSPIAASPTLRELSVIGCPPVDLEVAALNAMLPSWDDHLLLPKPRPLPPLRMIIAPQKMHPRRDAPPRDPGDPELHDEGIRNCEARWVPQFANRLVAERIGHSDWGKVTADGVYRKLTATVECYEVVDRLPEIVDALREVLASLRHEYMGDLMIYLRVPPPEPTQDQKDLFDRFQREQEEAAAEQRRRDDQQRIENLYLHQLQQQQGAAGDPQEFPVPPMEEPPPPPWEIEKEDDDEEDEELGDLAVKKLPEPPPMMFDHEHPLADHYSLSASFTLRELWFDPHHAPLGIDLMGRDPDEEIHNAPGT